MQVIKYSGDREAFSSRKIYSTVKDAGGSKKLAREAIREIRKNYHKDMTTQEILEILLKTLNKEPGVAERYNLKQAIMNLGPTGFPFEKYFAKILEYYGFETEVGQNLKGKVIYHEVDIIAKKKVKFMIECKYHNHAGTLTRLHPAMYTYARFLDLKQQNFDKAWLVTNTKCSLDAKRYAKGVKLKLTTWGFPKDQSLQKLIERKKLYPITILKSIDEETKNKMFEKGLIMLQDFEKFSEEEIKEKFNLSEQKSKEIIKDIYNIIG